MIFRQLIDKDSSTYTYLLGDPWSREAVILDPVRENLDRDLGLLRELGLTLTTILETHIHADHVTAAALLRAATGAKVGIAGASRVEGADLHLEDGEAIRFGLQALEVRATPGHTNCSVCYVTASRDRVFTGDTLLIRGCGRTDFQEGDARTLYRSVRDKLFSLPLDTLVYPAHDYQGRTCSSVREETLYNPRLGGGRGEDEFAAIMAALNLAYPRKMDVAVPANRRCGLLDAEEAPALAPAHTSDWPVCRTPTGAPNLSPLWVAQHRRGLRLVDIREREEWAGPDGHLAGVEWIPMGRFPEAARGWEADAPVVLICRSGGRSDRLALELEGRGLRRVASLTGGLLRWAALGLGMEEGVQG